MNPELVRDLNFMMIFHNWMIPDRSNSLLSLEAIYCPFSSLQIHLQVAMDEFATAYESNLNGGGGPPIFGYLAGARWVIPAGDGYIFVEGEGAYTNPWLYNRRKPPYYFNVKRIWSLVTNKYEYLVKPVGFWAGPDSITAQLRVRYASDEIWDAGLELLYLIQGENTYATPWAPEKDDMSPTGIPEKALVVKLTGTYHFLPWLSLSGAFYADYTQNSEHVMDSDTLDFEVVASATIEL
jgi:hypothetical protein